MQLTFDIADELDLTNEIPSALNAISALVLALKSTQALTTLPL